MGVCVCAWERWAEEKGAHVLTAAVCAGAGRAEQRQTQVQMQRGNDDDSGGGSSVVVVVVVVAGQLWIRQKQESRALPPWDKQLGDDGLTSRPAAAAAVAWALRPVTAHSALLCSALLSSPLLLLVPSIHAPSTSLTGGRAGGQERVCRGLASRGQSSRPANRERARARLGHAAKGEGCYPARRSEAGRSAARLEAEGMRHGDMLDTAGWLCVLWPIAWPW